MTFRYRVVLLVFAFLFTAITIRLFYWQVIRAEELSQMGQDQYGREISQEPVRGEIRTSDGYPIVSNKLNYRLYVNPKVVEDQVKTTDLLSQALEVEPASISGKLIIDKYYVPLAQEVDNETKEKIESYDLPGIGFEEQNMRLYPEASMAAHLIGFVGKDAQGLSKGYFGIEGYYDRQLRGKGKTSFLMFDALGRPITDNNLSTLATKRGRNLVLNVDRVVQFTLDAELKKGIERYRAEGGMAGIIDPKTGAILAMSSFPTFDPRTYSEFEDKLYKNPFITDTYEPGSTFKPLIMASAIDAGVLEADTRCDICDKPIEIGGYTIKTWNNEYYPNSTMIDVIKHSDNTGMVFTGQKLGLEKMLYYFDRFGIGKLTGIDLQGEVTPELRQKENWYPIDLATASFGQGVTVTPIELLTAFASLANGGIRMEPHVVANIETDSGEMVEVKPKEAGRTVSAKTAKIMTEILVNSAQAGEAKWAAPKGYRIAGKTGTAQIPIAGHYDPSQTIASFIGFAPADDPQFVMLVVVDRPKTSIYGSETAAPIFFNVAKKLLLYYGIEPTEPIED